MSELLSQFDAWINDGGPSALVLKEYLQPAAGPGEVVFPPTFAPPEDQRRDAPSYIIDGEGKDSVCLLDTVGSQANRLEPVFMKAPHDRLVPQIGIQVKDRKINLLELGHRAADAVARSTSLAAELQTAFTDFDKGNPRSIAKIAPTTLVFGAWDSRGTQIKIPRLIESTIRGFNVAQLSRAAQYSPGLKNEEISELLADVVKEREALSAEGFLDAPSRALGGVIVKGDIVRTTVVNLTALRAIGGSVELRRYILGLALVAASAPLDLFLRQGCLLVRAAGRPMEQKLVYRDGTSQDSTESIGAAAAFAAAAAQAFGVGESRSVEFDPKLARAALDKGSEKKAKKAK